MSPFNEQIDLNILAEDNVRTLELPKGKLGIPTVVGLIGIPGSGKTYLSKYLVQSLPIALLSEEEMLKFLAPRLTFFNRAQDQVVVLALKTMEKLIKKGVSCIFDFNIKKRHDRQIFKQTVEAAGGKFILIHVDVDKEEAYKRITKGNYQVTRGEKKGVILNKDLFEYEVASTMVPIAEEKALKFNSNNPEGMETLLLQISKLTSVS